MLPLFLRRVSANYLTKIKTHKLNINFLRCGSNIIRSDFPDIVVPDVTLPEYIFSNFSKFPNKISLECSETGRKYTFEEVRKKSINLNKALRKIFKLKKGDITAIIAPNIPEYPICIIGSLLANLSITTVNPAGTINEISRQLVNTKAKAIFTICSMEKHVRQIVQTLPSPIPVISIKTKVTDSIGEGFINFNELVDVNNFDVDDKYLVNVNDIACIPYSSGTTGLQKGVLHSHYSLVSYMSQLIPIYKRFLKPTTESYQDVMPIVIPYFHIYGLAGILMPQLYHMSKQVTINKFIPDKFISTLEYHKPRILFLVPPLVLFLSNSPNVSKKHIESVEYVLSGGAPLGATDEERLIKKSEGKLNITQAYGLTEAPLLLIDQSQNRLNSGSVGKPIQNTEIKIVPVDNVLGEALGPHKEGEILVKGPQLMVGYLNNPTATAESFVDGWLRTGDLGYYDEHNNFFIKDRLKELIKVKAHQVAPAELEELIRSYPNVTDAVVIGIPHEAYGEVPRAYITLKSNTKIDLKELEKFVKDNVAKYKQILGGFSIVDFIPKTASGKYLRKDLKEQYVKQNIK